jgi:hypothetical protein
MGWARRRAEPPEGDGTASFGRPIKANRATRFRPVFALQPARGPCHSRRRGLDCPWARVTDEAKRRRQELVVCRAALPFEGLIYARSSVTPAPAFFLGAARRADTLALARTADSIPISEAFLVSWARLVADRRAAGIHRTAAQLRPTCLMPRPRPAPRRAGVDGGGRRRRAQSPT